MRSQAKTTEEKKKTKMKALKVTITAEDGDSSDSESTGLVVEHACLLVQDLMVSGSLTLKQHATCAIYQKSKFIYL